MKTITVEIDINANIDKVWDFWTMPEHITKWTFASDDWESPFAENDLVVGGKFLTRMSSKDKTQGFDFGGTYSNVVKNKKIEYVMDDGRKVSIDFLVNSNVVKVTEEFEIEEINSEDKQRAGWQSILENFKKYVESN